MRVFSVGVISALSWVSVAVYEPPLLPNRLTVCDSISLSPSSPTSAPIVNPKMNCVSTSAARAAIGVKANAGRKAAIHFLAIMGRMLHPLATRGSSPMTQQDFPIGVAATRSGVKVPTIRYYEQIGLLPRPPRTKSNRRRYDANDLNRLAFICHAREQGFDIQASRALLTLQDNPDQSCVAADVIARARLDEVEQRIATLIVLKAELQHMIAECSRGRVAECRVIEVLADHSKKQVAGRAASAG
jgi:DNA-binding transcriptional MerR regulator